MAKKPTHKTRAARKLESLGWIVGDVEKWIPQAKKRIDLFNLLDLVALNGKHTLGLQVTSDSGGNVSDHVRKMLEEPRLWACLAANWKIEVWGIRNREVRDGSFAVVRSFELEKGGGIEVFDSSSILK